MQHSAYHIALRISTLTLALVLVFESGLLSPITKQLANQTEDYVASVVGATASVAPNELNTITAALTERETELNAREAAIAEREISVSINEGGSATVPDYGTYILSVLLFILLVLITLNYALDYARQRRLRELEEGVVV